MLYSSIEVQNLKKELANGACKIGYFWKMISIFPTTVNFMLVTYKVMRPQFFSLQAKTHPSMGMITPVRRIWVKICWFSDFGRTRHEMTIPISTPADDHQFTMNDLKSPKEKKVNFSAISPNLTWNRGWGLGNLPTLIQVDFISGSRNIMKYNSNSSTLYTEIYEYTF